MITRNASDVNEAAGELTLCGLTPTQLHDRFWAARGVQVVRFGDSHEVASNASLYMLTDSRRLVSFRLRRVIDTLLWVRPRVLYVVIRDNRYHQYRERIVTDEQQRLVRVQRLYNSAGGAARVAITADQQLALAWQSSTNIRKAWYQLRRSSKSTQQLSLGDEPGGVYDRFDNNQLVDFSHDLVQIWERPGTALHRLVGLQEQVWVDHDAHVDPSIVSHGPVWVGAGRRLGREPRVVGPAILWDEPTARPKVEPIDWNRIDVRPASTGMGWRPKPQMKTAVTTNQSTLSDPDQPRGMGPVRRLGKRAFDLIFSVIVLAVTLPFYPLIMLAIVLEDGWGFFFVHRREMLGGRQFPCLKFRSMRKDAGQLKYELAGKNKADGPQFFIEDDPRVTRVGQFMRRFNIDELPQFINVLLGHMSVIGPRPSPFEENQYCPAWREARLSVRPGITGLWQIMRRRNHGEDFQEWIKYDIEYVEKASLKLDAWILWKTIQVVLRQAKGS